MSKEVTECEDAEVRFPEFIDLFARSRHGILSASHLLTKLSSVGERGEIDA